MNESPIRSRTVLGYMLLFIAPLVPVIALGAISYGIAARSAEDLIRNRNESAAAITGFMVEQKFNLRVNGLRAFAGVPDFVNGVRRTDRDGVRERLRVLVKSDSKVIRAFVTDPEGRLWSDYPPAPESIGDDFSHREWFEGLSKNWEPYVSSVYRRHAAPQLLLIAVAVPVRDPETNDVLAALVYQVDLEGMSDLLARVNIGSSGYVFLLDGRGHLISHPHLDLQHEEHNEYAGSPVAAANGGNRVSFNYRDPVSGEVMLAATVPCRFHGARWVAVAQQPVREAYQPIYALRWQIANAGILFVLMLALFLALMVRSDARVRRLSGRLSDTNAELHHENQERRAAEEALAAMNTELEQRVERRTNQLREVESQLVQSQKMEAIGRLAGGVAHDFNNLLTVISGYTTLLLADSSKDEDTREALREIQDAAARAGGVTRQLLAFSRRQVMQPVHLDVNEVVENMRRMLCRLIGEDIELVTRLQRDLHPVFADRGQLEQVIMNLVVNARDAMPKGGKLTLETNNVVLDDEYVSTHADAQQGPHVMIALSDTGVGMDAETQSRLFEPFFTTKEGGKGTGLGLSTVYGIVKQTGGNIWVYSEPGQGTVFKVYFPASPNADLDAPEPAPEQTDTAGTETILVVEDDDGVRTLIARVLGTHGYTVLTAARPEEAIEQCREGAAIDLLLTDVVMPEMNGKALAERIRELLPEIRVVFMSGYTDDAIVHHGVLEEGVAFIEKPISPDLLLRRIREFLR